MDYYVLQFDDLKFVLEARLHRRSVPNFNFFNVKAQISHRNCKGYHSNCLDANFHNISDISLRDIRCRAYNYCLFSKRKVYLLNISGVNEESINFTDCTLYCHLAILFQ